jgi:hypothetical protein
MDDPLVDTMPVGGAGINKLLLAIIGVLTTLWLVTLYALIRNKRSPATSHKTKSGGNKASQKAALKQLQIACQKKQPTAVRDTLTQWAKTRWPQDPPNNLEDIAMRLDDWDAQAIWQVIKGLPATLHNTSDRNDDSLEPLYR